MSSVNVSVASGWSVTGTVPPSDAVTCAQRWLDSARTTLADGISTATPLVGFFTVRRICVTPPSESDSGRSRRRVMVSSGLGSSPGALATGRAMRVSPLRAPSLIVSMTSAYWSSNDPLGSARNLCLVTMPVARDRTRTA